MGKAAKVAKWLLDFTLVLLVIGVIGTGFTVLDFSSGVVHMVIPTEFTPSQQTLKLQSHLLGTGLIDSASAVVTFDARIASLPAAVYLLYLAMSMAPAFFMVVLLRKIATTVAAGDPFADANISRVRAIGWLTIGFWVLLGALDLAAKMVVAETSTMAGNQLGSSGGWNYYVLLLGVVIIGMAEVFRYGKQLQSDADLTV